MNLGIAVILGGSYQNWRKRMTSKQFLMQLGSFNTEYTEVAIPRLLVKRPSSHSARENCLISINTVLGLSQVLSTA